MGDGACKRWRLARWKLYQANYHVSGGGKSAEYRRKKAHQECAASHDRKSTKTPTGSSQVIMREKDKDTLNGCIQPNNEPEEEKATSGKPTRKCGE